SAEKHTCLVFCIHTHQASTHLGPISAVHTTPDHQEAGDMTHPPSPLVEAPTRPIGLTRCTTPTPSNVYDVSGIEYDPRTQMSASDGQALIDQPLLDTAVQSSVTTIVDMHAWTDPIIDG